MDPPWTQGWYGFRKCITRMHGMLDVDRMHLAPAVAWPTSSASICRDFPFGRSDMQPTIWPQSADLVVSKCLLKSTDQLCRTIFRVFATLVCGRPRLLCPALFHEHEKRQKALVGATDVAVATFY